MHEYIQLYKQCPVKPLMFSPGGCEGYFEVLQGGNEMFQEKL